MRYRKVLVFVMSDTVWYGGAKGINKVAYYWASADTQKRFDDISNGCVFLTSKRINFGLHDVSDDFNDVSNDFKPNCHTT